MHRARRWIRGWILLFSLVLLGPASPVQESIRGWEFHVSSVRLAFSFLFLTQRINHGKPPSQQTMELGFFLGTKS